MEPAMKPLRVCDAFGGRMDLPSSLKDSEELMEKCISCRGVWVPIFRESEEQWVDRENEVVEGIEWAIGQPNGGDHEKCAILLASKNFMTILSDGSQAKKKQKRQGISFNSNRKELVTLLYCGIIN